VPLPPLIVKPFIIDEFVSEFTNETVGQSLLPSIIAVSGPFAETKDIAFPLNFMVST